MLCTLFALDPALGVCACLVSNGLFLFEGASCLEFDGIEIWSFLNEAVVLRRHRGIVELVGLSLGSVELCVGVSLGVDDGLGGAGHLVLRSLDDDKL